MGRRRALIVIGLVLAVGALSSCRQMVGEERADAKPRVVKLRLKSSPYGDVLFANGYAQYVFTKDRRKRSRCYRGCARAWPPLRAGRMKLGPGLDRSLLGTIRRRGGGRQLTYAGRPLYGYVDDPRGKVLCHDVVEFGGTWYAVLGSGNPAPS